MTGRTSFSKETVAGDVGAQRTRSGEDEEEQVDPINWRIRQGWVSGWRRRRQARVETERRPPGQGLAPVPRASARACLVVPGAELAIPRHRKGPKALAIKCEGEKGSAGALEGRSLAPVERCSPSCSFNSVKAEGFPDSGIETMRSVLISSAFFLSFSSAFRFPLAGSTSQVSP